MQRRLIRAQVTPPMAVAFTALLVALGGTSYAVTRLPERSVGSAQLKREAVTRAAIRDGAVTGVKVANGTLTGRDVREATLREVASAALADRAVHAGTTDHATSSGALDRVAYRGAAGTVEAATPPTETEPTVVPATAAATARCEPGLHVAGGGVQLEDTDTTVVVHGFPDLGGRGWTAVVRNEDDTAAHGFTVYAICLPSGVPG